jgi:hypothetical protein
VLSVPVIFSSVSTRTPASLCFASRIPTPFCGCKLPEQQFPGRYATSAAWNCAPNALRAFSASPRSATPSSSASASTKSVARSSSLPHRTRRALDHGAEQTPQCLEPCEARRIVSLCTNFRSGSGGSTSSRAFRLRDARSPIGEMLLPVKKNTLAADVVTTSLTPSRRRRGMLSHSFLLIRQPRRRWPDTRHCQKDRKNDALLTAKPFTPVQFQAWPPNRLGISDNRLSMSEWLGYMRSHASGDVVPR